MSLNEALNASPSRRKLLGTIATLAGASTLLGAATASAVEPPALPDAHAPEELFALARLRNYKTRRSSSSGAGPGR